MHQQTKRIEIIETFDDNGKKANSVEMEKRFMNSICFLSRKKHTRYDDKGNIVSENETMTHDFDGVRSNVEKRSINVARRNDGTRAETSTIVHLEFNDPLLLLPTYCDEMTKEKEIDANGNVISEKEFQNGILVKEEKTSYRKNGVIESSFLKFYIKKGKGVSVQNNSRKTEYDENGVAEKAVITVYDPDGHVKRVTTDYYSKGSPSIVTEARTVYYKKGKPYREEVKSPDDRNITITVYSIDENGVKKAKTVKKFHRECAEEKHPNLIHTD